MTRSGSAALVLMLVSGCSRPSALDPALSGASAERGRAAVARYECGACHVIPGVPGAHGRVGPDLDGFRRRIYVAGVHPNSPQMLVRWIQDAPALEPQTAMPDVGVDQSDARDIAAYLYSLE